MLSLQTWSCVVRRRAARSLWSATLFRDNQTAVDADNGALRKKFRPGIEIFCDFSRKLRAGTCLGGSGNPNFRPKKNLFA
jgi:hypothetical protein